MKTLKNFHCILSSATKTFNIAGTKNSYAVIENPKLRVAFQNASWPITSMKFQVWGYLATEAAYRYGKDWLRELKEVIERPHQLCSGIVLEKKLKSRS